MLRVTREETGRRPERYSMNSQGTSCEQLSHTDKADREKTADQARRSPQRVKPAKFHNLRVDTSSETSGFSCHCIIL